MPVARMNNESRANHGSIRRWSITTLLVTILAFACAFAYIRATHPERVKERSIRASIKLHMDFDVPMHDIYVTRAAVQLPMRDKNGDVTTGSCGPHLDLSSPRYDRAMLRKMIPTIRQVVPRTACSHVAVYLNSQVYKDADLVTNLEAALPNVVVFDESRHFSRHSP